MTHSNELPEDETLQAMEQADKAIHTAYLELNKLTYLIENTYKEKYLSAEVYKAYREFLFSSLRRLGAMSTGLEQLDKSLKNNKS